jgi:hypothetical protein
MKYYLFMYHEEKTGASLPREEMDRWMEKIKAWSDSMRQAGVLLKAEGLHPTAAATTVRVRNGKSLTTHGPFAETKEQLGGAYLIEVPNLDEALAWAAKSPQAEYGSVEVRPVWDLELKAAAEAAREKGYFKK